MRARLLLVLIIWFALLKILTWPITIRMADDVQIPQGTTLAPVGEISRGQVVRQQLPAPGSAINTISIYLATYQRTIRWPIVMRIEVSNPDGTWTPFWSRVIEASSIADNAYYTMNFSPPLVVPPTPHLAIALSSDAPAGQAASWWGSPSWIRTGYQLTINDQPLPGNAVMTLQYNRVQGPLITLLPAMWRRVTAFLTAPWQLLLFAAALLGLGALARLCCSPPIRSEAITREADATPRE